MVAEARWLVVNADDFGLSPAVNRGIVELAAAGIVTSASLLMNLPSTTDALSRAADSGLDVGVHLNLTVGPPLSGLQPGLTRADGWMGPIERVLWRLGTGQLRLATIEQEWAAQIEAFLTTGRRPYHLDSHLHLHALPGLAALIGRLARRYGIGAVRLPGHGLVLHQALPLLPADLVRHWRLPLLDGRASEPRTSEALLVLTAMGPQVTTAAINHLWQQLPPGLTELVTHPGYVDDELCRLDRLQWDRETELRLLRDGHWPERLAELGVRLTSFRAVLEERMASGPDV